MSLPEVRHFETFCARIAASNGNGEFWYIIPNRRLYDIKYSATGSGYFTWTMRGALNRLSGLNPTGRIEKGNCNCGHDWKKLL